MKNNRVVLYLSFLIVSAAVVLTAVSCGNTPNEEARGNPVDSVAENINMYSHVWDEIINNRNLDMFNEKNFTTDVVMHSSPSDIVGIDSARAFYAHYLTGFSDIQFTIRDIFGMGNKLVKHWNFKGTHTGDFFGIPPTGKKVDLQGVTLVRMQDGKIAEEQDFFDSVTLMQQLGLLSSK